MTAIQNVMAKILFVLRPYKMPVKAKWNTFTNKHVNGKNKPNERRTRDEQMPRHVVKESKYRRFGEWWKKERKSKKLQCRLNDYGGDIPAHIFPYVVISLSPARITFNIFEAD